MRRHTPWQVLSCLMLQVLSCWALQQLQKVALGLLLLPGRLPRLVSPRLQLGQRVAPQLILAGIAAPALLGRPARPPLAAG